MSPGDLRTDRTSTVKNTQAAIYAKSGVTLLGIVFIAFGAYLPWLQRNPWWDGTIFNIHYLTSTGIRSMVLVYLLPAAIVLGALTLRGSTRGWAWGSFLTGLWTVWYPIKVIVDQYTILDLYFIPDIGLVLTFLGGSAFIAVGGYDLFAD